MFHFLNLLGLILVKSRIALNYLIEEVHKTINDLSMKLSNDRSRNRLPKITAQEFVARANQELENESVETTLVPYHGRVFEAQLSHNADDATIAIQGLLGGLVCFLFVDTMY